MIRRLGFFLTFSFFVSCIDEQYIINDIVIITVKQDPLKGIPDEGPLQFDKPAIGQRSSYIHFKAFPDQTSGNVQYQYGADTLIIAIVGKSADQWVINEFLTAGSSSIQSSKGYFDTDSVYVTLLRITNDSIAFKRPTVDLNSTYFFSFHYDDFLAYPLPLYSEPAKLNSTCSPFFDHYPRGAEYTLDYTQLGQTFGHLNIYADYAKTEVDGVGVMYVYSPADGFVRMAWYIPWTNEASGWDLVPK